MKLYIYARPGTKHRYLTNDPSPDLTSEFGWVLVEETDMDRRFGIWLDAQEVFYEGRATRVIHPPEGTLKRSDARLWELLEKWRTTPKRKREETIQVLMREYSDHCDRDVATIITEAVIEGVSGCADHLESVLRNGENVPGEDRDEQQG